jgi:hypothetical protein
VGFSESEIKGSIRTLLYALVRDDGTYQLIGRTGNGLSGEQKEALYKRLAPTVIKSNYIEVDSNHAVFHIVMPSLVVELSLTDVIAENASGAVSNPLLAENGGALNRAGAVNGYSFVSAVIERLRGDKQPDSSAANIRQVSAIYAASPERTLKQAGLEKGSLPASTMQKREVYKKEGKSFMLLKFLTWKTNKEDYGYPAYVFSFTNFSAGRAEPLSVDIRISSSEAQITQIEQEFEAKHVKTGWVKDGK